jgi:putative membrane protein
MIIYEPNKNWFRDIVNLTKSWTLRKIMYGVLLIGIYTTVLSFVVSYFEYDPMIHSGIFSLLGIILSILLVFRTNSAYDRWWEGRKQWGALVNHSRNFAIYVKSIIPSEDEKSRVFFAKHVSNFSIALKEHLRDGVKVEELVLVDEKEIAAIEDKVHKPNYISSLIFERLQNMYKAGVITDADMINIKPQHQAFLDILGACERIRKTPIPFSYAVYIKVFIMLYGLMLPFGMITDFGFYTIPLVMFIFFAMIGLELMAEEIEEPFGMDCNDLATGDMAHNIKNNVFEILEADERHREPIKRELYEKIH